MFFFFLLSLFFLGDGLTWATLHRLLHQAETPLSWRVVLALFMFVQMAGLATIILSRFWAPALGIQNVWGKAGLSLVFIWHFLVLLPLGLFLIVRSLVPHSVAAQIPSPISGLTRRQFLALAAASWAPLASVAMTGVGLYQLRRFRIRRIDVDIPDLPPALEGVTIAHLSDIHVGQLSNGAVLEDMARAFNDLGADIGVVTGDLINYDLNDLPAALGVVSALHARHGVYVCEGNHDLLENAAEFEARARAIESADHRLLLNEAAGLEIAGQPVQILGLRWTGQEDAGIAWQMRRLPPIAPDVFPILLAHHPHAFEMAEAAGIPLILSGHTHGGQLMLTDDIGCGPLFFRYWSGLYRRGKSRLIVSNGTGNWFPLRINAPAEILHLTLRRAKA